jgi:hypothetical protein
MALLRLILTLAASAAISLAQELPAPKSIRISFLPPPLEGTLSLGIYDASGHLVRVLQREADVDDFTIEADALSTTWDGKNDAGELLPPGKYHARGFGVATADVEGIGYFFNDWVTDEQSLRITAMSELTMANGMPLLSVKLRDRALTILCDGSGNIVETGDRVPPSDRCSAESEPPRLIEPISCDTGKDETRWVIDRIAPGSPETEVKQFSRTKELLRRLSIARDDPQPRAIGASRDADTIFLLEESGPLQRFRSLTLVAKSGSTAQSISDWRVDYERKITAHKDFTLLDGKPVISGGKTPTDRLTVKLQPNPLKHDKRESVELVVAFDEDGSYLQTADGLPLASISDTPHLTRVVLSPRGENSIDVFQDDDTVVEQFRISDLDQMMAFDAGEIELK